MKREEAIHNLNMISVAFVEPVTKEQRKIIDDTFDMAIKALEQEPILDKIYNIYMRTVEGVISEDRFFYYLQNIFMFGNTLEAESEDRND